ncbi:MAG: (d)CMP kinase, partial [Sulfuricella sp.]
MFSFSICLDGWSGSGKTSLAIKLSNLLRLPVVHTGMIYRSITAIALRERCVLSDLPALAVRVFAEEAILSGCLSWPEAHALGYEEIWADAVSQSVSDVACVVGVRTAVKEAVRAFLASHGPAIVEGRDV